MVRGFVTRYAAAQRSIREEVLAFQIFSASFTEKTICDDHLQLLLMQQAEACSGAVCLPCPASQREAGLTDLPSFNDLLKTLQLLFK